MWRRTGGFSSIPLILAGFGLLWVGGAPRASAQPAAFPRTGSGGSLTGVASCDRYIQFYYCYLQQLPAASRRKAQQSYVRVIQSFRRSVMQARRKNPASLMTYVKACQHALGAMARLASRNANLNRCLQRLGAAPLAPQPPAAPPAKKRLHGRLPGACVLFHRRYQCFLHDAPAGLRTELHTTGTAWSRLQLRLALRHPASAALRRKAVRWCTQADAALRRRIALNRSGLRCLRLRRPPRPRPAPPRARRTAPRR